MCAKIRDPEEAFVARFGDHLALLLAKATKMRG
jgi:hypothetical protein